MDEIKIWGTNLSAVLISFADIEMALKILTLCVALGYTIWKWMRDYKKGE